MKKNFLTITLLLFLLSGCGSANNTIIENDNSINSENGANIQRTSTEENLSNNTTNSSSET